MNTLQPRSSWIALTLLLASFLLFSAHTLRAQIVAEELHTSVDANYKVDYLDISCSDDHNYTVVGYSSVSTSAGGYQVFIIRTRDAGKTWETQPCGFPHQSAVNQPHLTKVFSFDSLNVTAIGDSGYAYRTTDAGVTWNGGQSGTWELAMSVSFRSPLEGTVCAGDGARHQTKDGGMTWSIDSTYYHRYAWFCHLGVPNEEFVWLAGRGPFLHTTDDGDHWDSTQQLTNGTTVPLSFTKIVNGYCQSLKQSLLFGVHVLADTPRYVYKAFVGRTNGANNPITTVLDSNMQFVTGLSTYSENGEGHIIAAGSGSGILFSNDNGEHWQVDTIVDHTLEVVSVNTVSFAGQKEILLVEPTTKGASILKFQFPESQSVRSVNIVANPVHVYPNPASSTLTIVGNDESMLEYKLFDLLGRSVRQFNAQPVTTISVDDLPSAVYRLVGYKKSGQVNTHELVVIHP